MGRLSKLSNSAAALVIFLAWYASASVTVALLGGKLGEMLQASATVLFAVLAFMTVTFVMSRVVGRTDVVDAAWGPAFLVAALTAFMINPYGISVGLNIQTLVTLLVAIWAIRLCVTISLRLRGQPEDKRYVELRRQWKGNLFLNSYLRIFVVQALLAVVVSSAVIHINLSLPQTITTYGMIGLALWVVGFLFEAIGDAQLKRFLANPAHKGTLMTRGLWKYTRHPNYFGEATMWLGIFVMALSVPNGWLGVITPVVITYLLLFVSGVPMTEKAFEGRPGWEAYKRKTSKFFPLPPNPE